MDDHELRKRLARLPIPQADAEREDEALQHTLRAFRAAGEGERVSAAAWTWRDWLWPSPLVWSGFAALWLVMIVRSAMQPAGAPSGTPPLAHENGRAALAPSSMLLARDDVRVLLRQFQGEQRAP